MINTAQRNSLLTYFDRWTLAKGKDYFERGRVKTCTESKGGKIMGIVKGTREYLATVDLNSNEIKKTKCSCPMISDCKHTAALLYCYLDKHNGTFPDSEQPYNGAQLEGDLAKSTPLMTIIPSAPDDKLPKSQPNAALETPITANSNSNSNSSSSSSSHLSQLQALRPMGNELRQVINRLAFANRSVEEEQHEELNQAKTAQSSKRGSRSLLIYVLGDQTYNTAPKIFMEKVALRPDGQFGATNVVHLDTLLKNSNIPQYITPKDIEIAKLWRTLAGESFYSYYGSTAKLDSDPELLRVLLERILATGRCYAKDKFEQPLKLGRALSGKLAWHKNANGFQNLGIVAVENLGSTDGEIEHPCFKWRIPWYIDQANSLCGPVNLNTPMNIVDIVLNFPAVTESDAENLQLVLPELGLAKLIPEPHCKRKIELRLIKPVPKLELDTIKTKRVTVLDSRVIPEGTVIRTVVVSSEYPRQAAPDLFVEGEKIVKEKLAHGNEPIVQQIKDLGFEPIQVELLGMQAQNNKKYLIATHNEAWLNLLLKSNQEFKQDGWQIADSTMAQLSPLELGDSELNFEVSEEDNWWFSLALNIEINGKSLPLLPILVSAIKSLPAVDKYSESFIDHLNADGKFYATLEDGKLVSLPFERIRPILISLHELLLSDPLRNPKSIQLSALEASALMDGAGGSRWHGAENMLELAERLKKLISPPAAQAPEGLKAELRPYQLEGLSWLNLLAEQKFAGILADDMGLGKTIQLLAFICGAKASGKLKKRPFLVLSPTSVLPNWLSECARFAPHLKVLPLSGSDRANRFSQIKDADVVLSTYPLLVRDLETLQSIKWSGIALDESQAIKNPKTQLAKAARMLKADYRFCLTGTPIENHLGELWSQFQFLLPGFLGETAWFKNFFRDPIEKETNCVRRTLLANRVRPFILRRTKQEVAQELPDKTVIIKSFELEGLQRDLYETVRLASTKQIRDEIASKGFKQSQIMILDALLKLRQVCCDPRLVKLSAARKVSRSCKLENLLEMVSELQAEGRKVLIFSQFTSMLDLIALELSELNISYVQLRGSTKDRVTPVTEFQTSDTSVFLLSLKAGGTGLNLTAADTVIHYDPWWNPAAEAQATDRAHRIGQTKNVFVYKLIAKGTIEERMLELQERKQGLANAIYADGGNANFSFNETDIDLLLSPMDELA